MKNIGTVPIETERLLLRRVVKADADDIFSNWASDPLVTRYMTWKTHESVAVTRCYVASLLRALKLSSCYEWIIVLKETNRAIGAIGVAKLDSSLESAQVGYCLSRAFWNRGIMSEALGAVIGFLFNEVGVNRIEAYHHVKNIVSGRVMEKSGMLKEGIRRDGERDSEGVFCDTVCYAILKSDYLKNRAKP